MGFWWVKRGLGEEFYTIKSIVIYLSGLWVKLPESSPHSVSDQIKSVMTEVEL